MFGSEQASMVDTQSDPATALRGWWKANKEKTKVEGLEESLSLIRDVLKEQRFDVRIHIFSSSILSMDRDADCRVLLPTLYSATQGIFGFR